MPLRANYNVSGRLVPALGFPLALNAMNHTEISGVIPKGSKTVTVTAYASQAANLHLALSDTPATSSTPLVDGAILSDVDADTGVISYAQTDTALTINEIEISINVPDWETILTPYVFRLWATEIEGAAQDDNEHDSDVDVEDQPFLPGTVYITDIVVS